MESTLKWVFVKKGWAAFDGDKGVGTVFIPRKGNWHEWIILDGTYNNTGKANGKTNAMRALEAAYRKDTDR